MASKAIESEMRLNIQPFLDNIRVVRTEIRNLQNSLNQNNSGDNFRNININVQNLNRQLRDTQRTNRDTRRSFVDLFGGLNRSGGEANVIIQRLTRFLADLRREAQGASRDMTRIVGGIILAQGFYKITSEIKAATNALWEFVTGMENINLAFRYFIPGAENVKTFSNYMQDFAAVTPFVSSEVAMLTRRLMAMGIGINNVKSVMEILTDASVASGGTSEEMNRIVIAIGQIKTQGYLAAQEVRQLANAQIPVYTILREELGLTADQMKQIGKLKIPGTVAIEALLRGLNKRYKGAAENLAETTSGMISTIKDDLLILGAAFSKPLMGAIELVIRGIRNRLEVMREAFRQSGIGGAFEALFGSRLQAYIRIIIGSFISLGKTAITLFRALKPLLGEALLGMLDTIRLVLPYLAGFASSMSGLAQSIVKTFPKVRELAATITGLFVAYAAAKALMFLWAVLRLSVIVGTAITMIRNLVLAIQALWIVVSANPITLAIAAIVAAITALAAYSYGGGQAVTYLINRLKALLQALVSFGKINADDILKPVDQGDLGKNMDMFNDSIIDGTKDLTAYGDEAEKTGKKIKKSLLSFDEVFTLNPKDASADDLLNDEDVFGSLEPVEVPFTMPDLSDFELPVFKLPKIEIPDFKELISKAWKSAKDFLNDNPLFITVEAFLKDNFSWVIDIFAKIGKSVAPLKDIISDTISNLDWTPAKKGADNLKESFENLYKAADNLMEPLKLLAGFMAVSLTLSFEYFGSVVNGIIKALPNFVGLSFDLESAMMDVYAAMYNLITFDTSGLENSLELFFTHIGDAIGNAWEALRNFTKGFFESVIKLSDPSTSILPPAIAEELQSFLKVLYILIDAFEDNLEPAIENVRDAFYSIDWSPVIEAFGQIKNELSFLWETIKPILLELGKLLAGIFGGAVLGIIITFGTVISNVFRILSILFAAVLKTLPSVMGVVMNAVGTIRNLFMLMFGLFSLNGDMIKESLQNIVINVEAFISNVLGAFIIFFGEIFKGTADMFGDLLKVFVSSIGLVLAQVLKLFGTTPEKIKESLKGLGKIISSAFTDAFSVIKGFFKKAGEIGFELGDHIMIGIGNAIKGLGKLYDKLVKFFEGIWGYVKEPIIKFGETIGEAFKGIINGVIDIMNKAFQKLDVLTNTKIPDWVPGVGGNTIGIKIPEIPKLAAGGIATKRSIIEVAEAQNSEAIIPLNKATIRMFTDAIANGLATQQTFNTPATAAQSAGNVNFLLIDNSSLRELKRRLDLLDLKERRR